MLKTRTIALTLSALTLTACSETDTAGSSVPTRGMLDPLTIHADPAMAKSVSEQADALNASARGIVRASTLKGAMIGAALGCGVGVLTADPKACIKAGVVGAVGGAIAGNASGKRDVARRVELASPNNLVRNLRKANHSLSEIKQSLPNLLAQQNAELNQLNKAFASHQISMQQHHKRVQEITAERAALAEALSLTAAQARVAAANLKTASANGHSGLDWHILATEKLADDTISARSTISLL